jgi:hypothetical protein
VEGQLVFNRIVQIRDAALEATLGEMGLREILRHIGELKASERQVARMIDQTVALVDRLGDLRMEFGDRDRDRAGNAAHLDPVETKHERSVADLAVVSVFGLIVTVLASLAMSQGSRSLS